MCPSVPQRVCPSVPPAPLRVCPSVPEGVSKCTAQLLPITPNHLILLAFERSATRPLICLPYRGKGIRPYSARAGLDAEENAGYCRPTSWRGDKGFATLLFRQRGSGPTMQSDTLSSVISVHYMPSDTHLLPLDHLLPLSQSRRSEIEKCPQTLGIAAAGVVGCAGDGGPRASRGATARLGTAGAETSASTPTL